MIVIGNSYGAQGAVGTALTGSQGLVGTTGARGFQGNTGATGAQGFQGLVGSAPAVSGPPVAGYIAWFDANNAASITSLLTLVSQWNDLSGNSYHVVQDTGLNQPATGTRTQNSKNVLDLDGNDYLKFDLPNISQPITLFVVCKYDTLDGQILGNVSGGEQPVIFQSSGNWHMYAHTDVDTTVAGDTSAHTLAYVFNGASSTAFKDGTQIGGTLSPGAAALAQISIGANTAGASGVDGFVAEVIIYASALSTGNRNSVEAYLKAKWATP